ncbi:MAG: PSD1 domain-containing protein [Planctomycetaceae bacterium]|nr:PSD1 domain-containing protein [Planctomycetaceae bacterium]
MLRSVLRVGLSASLLVAGAVALAEEPSAIQFSRDIRPILAEHCLECHGAEKPEGGFRLTSREAALESGESGHPRLIPDQPDESEMLRRIRSADPAERMPPEGKKSLTTAEVRLLERWIREGAKWGQHWAFEPVVRRSPPEVRETSWIRHEIDRFVLAKLEAEGVTPSPEADRYTLIRRLSYDLVGLPPSVEEVDAFVNDQSPNAYQVVVERLLASPHFGERWGRHWLDLARYADSDGFEKDRARPDAYLYRDWVIDAINRDLPYDRFTVEQLAGDLLPEAMLSQRLATAFNRQTLTNEEGGVDQEEYRVAAVFDRTETLGTVWLGLTVGCARCHTHKYDPLSHHEYYGLFAFFNNADEASVNWPVSATDREEYDRAASPLQTALDRRMRELSDEERAWEVAARDEIMAQPAEPLAEHDALVEVATSQTGRLEIVAASTVVREARAKEEVPATDTYDLRIKPERSSITGLKIWALADDSLPQKGPGLAPNGNFVFTSVRAFLVSPDGSERPIALHRAAASFTQAKFPADAPLAASPAPKTGWAIAPKTGQQQWWQARTVGRLLIAPDETLRIVLEQNHGGQHVLGKFRLTLLDGDERGLQYERADIADALEMYPEKRVAAVQAKLFDYFVTRVQPDEEIAKLNGELAELRNHHRVQSLPARTLSSALRSRETHVFDRGDFQTPKDLVNASTPAILGDFQPRGAVADRLDLANWLVARDHPLTARVAVNHVWKHLFGEGFVRTMNDFGLRGESPSHPELLDWLADEFRTNLHWSRKDLIRAIVNSATYRQSSRHRPELAERDPLNVWLARQNRFRVEAEVLRDLSLAVSGLLSPKIGGPSVFPPMPEDLAALSYANNFSWKNSTGEDRYRRGMYTFFKRTVPHPSLMTFDSPDANLTCVARTVSNTPLQALLLLNNEAHREASQAFAQRVLGMDSTDAERLSQAWRVCVARPPSDDELAALNVLLKESRDEYRQHPEAAVAAVGEHPAVGVEVGENAAWVATLRILLNLDEFVTRE